MGLFRWFGNLVSVFKEMRLSYLPPLMVYAAVGISGITGIVGAFYVKERLGLSAEFLAMLGFWMGLPWVLKMPIGHLVDLFWRWKSVFIFLGAGLIGVSLAIMVGLLGYADAMTAFASVETWYIIASLMAPIGYVLQDVVADAMTVEAVPQANADGSPVSARELKLMHTTLQTLGRAAVIGGAIIVAFANIFLMTGVGDLPPAEKSAAYLFVYELSLSVPFVSIAGVVLAFFLRRIDMRNFMKRGYTRAEAAVLLGIHALPPPVNWQILGGGLAFVLVAVTLGLSDLPRGEEIIFVISMAIILFLLKNLMKELTPSARKTLIATAMLIFVFRAMPGAGDGVSWWMIDELHFDQEFMARLAFIGNILVLFGLLIFRRFVAERSFAYIMGFLTIVGTLLSLPTIGMYYGLHIWTAAHTGGIVDARFIALVDTAISSPLGQISMIPMLAWIANSAPPQLKATYFAVMASFTNLALSASTLGTTYLNHFFVVTREVRDTATNAVTTPADYHQLGMLLILPTVIGLVIPMLTIWIFGRHAEPGSTPAGETEEI